MQHYYLNKILRHILYKCIKNDFASFLKMGFYELNQGEKYTHNWHIDEICEYLIKVHNSELQRLIINIPPRYLKSISTSVCFVAWILGQNPYTKIIVSSYSERISTKHSLDTRKIMQSSWYKKIFPNTIIAKGENQKTKFCTTLGGFRMATSSGGSLTGEGGDLIILDDPQKPALINSKIYRENIVNWFFNTLLSRLNNKKTGAIVIVMQRLHCFDLCGVLISRFPNNWMILKLKLIAEEDEKYRKKGDLLHLERDGFEDVKKLKSEIGERDFKSQYQQSPIGEEESYFKEEYLSFIDFNLQEDDLIVISVDSASKIGINNDFTAITIWCIKEDRLILVNCKKVKLEFSNLISFMKNIILEYKSQFVLIEDKSSGISLIQEIRKYHLCDVISIKVKYDKVVRFLSVLGFFEQNYIFINSKVENVKDLKEELLLFPKAKHDDIVDSIGQFLNWYRGEFSLKIKAEPRIRKL